MTCVRVVHMKKNYRMCRVVSWLCMGGEYVCEQNCDVSVKMGMSFKLCVTWVCVVGLW